jgi:hypothetical protein
MKVPVNTDPEDAFSFHLKSSLVYNSKERLLVPHNRLREIFGMADIMALTYSTYLSLTNNVASVFETSDNSFRLNELSIEFLDCASFEQRYGYLHADGVAIYKEKKAVIKKKEFVDLVGIIGHEIGHLNTERSFNRVKEEAKAYAFSLAWTKDIARRLPAIMTDYEAELSCPVFYSKEEIEVLMAHDCGAEIHNNFPGSYSERLREDSSPTHNAARQIVAYEIKSGATAIDLYRDIVKGKLSIRDLPQNGLIGLLRDYVDFQGEDEK